MRGCATPLARKVHGQLLERGGLGAGDLAAGALRAVTGAGQDLEVGHRMERRRRAVVLSKVDDQAVEAGAQVVVVDLRLGRRRVAAGRADLLGEHPVGTGVLREVEGGADQAAAAEGAVNRSLQLGWVDAVRDPVQPEADMSLAELRFAAEATWRHPEVVDLDLDYDRM